MAVEIIFETHSRTEDNEKGIATGWLPGKLSEQGRQFAAELGARRRGTGIDAVFTSDLNRAVETARIAFDGVAIPIYQDSRLRECNYGDLNGCLVTVLAAERARRIKEPFPGGGQSYQQVVTLTAGCLQDLTRDWEGKRVLIIAHSANKWALDVLLNGASLEDLVDAPYGWRPGWTYSLPEDWVRQCGDHFAPAHAATGRCPAPANASGLDPPVAQPDE